MASQPEYMIEVREPVKPGRHKEEAMSAQTGTNAQREAQQRKAEGAYRSLGLTEAQARRAAQGRDGLILDSKPADPLAGLSEAQSHVAAKGRS